MNKTEFKKIVGETLKSQGFTYENKYYTFENADLKVFIGFQKSNFENSFYINYGFLIKGIYDGKLPLYKQGLEDFGGRFVYQNLDSYNLEKITSESLVASINSNIKMLIQPAFDDGLANYFELYPHFKFLCKKRVKEYLGF